MNNKEWIEYYRYHPSEFDNFVKFCDSIADEKERIEARVAELEAALKIAADEIQMQFAMRFNDDPSTAGENNQAVKLARRLLEVK